MSETNLRNTYCLETVGAVLLSIHDHCSFTSPRRPFPFIEPNLLWADQLALEIVERYFQQGRVRSPLLCPVLTLPRRIVSVDEGLDSPEALELLVDKSFTTICLKLFLCVCEFVCG